MELGLERPYYGLSGLQHALCKAHHLRELKALIEFEREPWAEAMSQFLRGANKRVAERVEQGEVGLAPDVWTAMSRDYDAILAQGVAREWKKAGLNIGTRRCWQSSTLEGGVKSRPTATLISRAMLTPWQLGRRVFFVSVGGLST